MSKSNDIDKFADYQAFFDYFASSLVDATKKVEEYSKSMNSILKSSLDREVAIKNSSKMTTTEINKSVSKMVETLEKMNIKLGEEGKAWVKSLRDTATAQSKKSGGLSVEKFQNDFINIGLTELFVKQQRALAKGDDSSFIKGFSKNKNAKNIADEINKQLGLSKEFNSIQYKLQTFFGKHFEEGKKNLKAFGHDLIEGLAKNKFIGGAMNDTFKLIGLLGANFLSQFGQFGKILGGAFYVAMETAGPLLVNLFLKGMGKLMGGLGSLLGKGAIALSTKGGGSLAGIVKAETLGQKALAVGKLGAGLGLAAGGTAIAVGAGKQAGEDWRTGHKGRAVAFGAGAGLAGLGAIAGIGSLFAAPLLPIAAALVTIGGVVAGLALLWKNFGKNITDWFKKLFRIKDEEKNENENKQSWWQNFVNWIKDAWEHRPKILGGKGRDDSRTVENVQSSLGHTQTRKEQETNIKEATSFGKLKVGKDGAILNISDLSQNEASKQLQAYEKANSSSFNKIYEWAGGDVARLSSFSTDAVKKNAQGQVTGALMYKGASTDLKALRSEIYNKLIEKGYSEDRAKNLADNLAFTSGRMTGSNTQHRGKGKWKSHDNIYGFGFDIGGGITWSEKDYKAAESVVKDFYRDRGFQVTYESEGQGKSTGKHWDIKPIQNRRAKGAEEILAGKNEQQKAVAEQHSISAMEVYSKLYGKEEAAKVAQEANKQNLDLEQTGKLYEAKLKEKGITFDPSANKGYIEVGDSRKDFNFDLDGNLTFLSKGANEGF